MKLVLCIQPMSSLPYDSSVFLVYVNEDGNRTDICEVIWYDETKQEFLEANEMSGWKLLGWCDTSKGVVSE